MSRLPNDRTRGPRRSLTEKVAIVRESLQPGMTVAHIAKKHRVALNVVYYWRRVYRDLVDADLSKAAPAPEGGKEVADLELQVRNLERILGRRTLEIELLREKLGIREDGDGVEPR